MICSNMETKVESSHQLIAIEYIDPFRFHMFKYPILGLSLSCTRIHKQPLQLTAQLGHTATSSPIESPHARTPMSRCPPPDSLKQKENSLACLGNSRSPLKLSIVQAHLADCGRITRHTLSPLSQKAIDTLNSPQRDPQMPRYKVPRPPPPLLAIFLLLLLLRCGCFPPSMQCILSRSVTKFNMGCALTLAMRI